MNHQKTSSAPRSFLQHDRHTTTTAARRDRDLKRESRTLTAPSKPNVHSCRTGRTKKEKNDNEFRDDQDGEEEEEESTESVRARIRRRIQQRASELQAEAATATAPAKDDPFPHFASDSMDQPQPASGESTALIASLHHDVVHTATQILGRYLETRNEESLELALVHRMLVKEVELEALHRQRGAQL